MSGGTISRNLYLIPEELEIEIENQAEFLPALTRERLRGLITKVEQMQKLVEAADHLLSGDTGIETFNFEWCSILNERPNVHDYD